MNTVIYCAPKNTDQFGAFALGFKGRMAPSSLPELDAAADLHIIGGLQFGAGPLLRQARERGVPYIFFDRAYFGGGPGTGVLRVTRGAYQQHWINERLLESAPSAHFRGARVVMRPWRKSGSHVLVVPPSSAVEQLFGVQGWLDRTLNTLREATDRPVEVSLKGDRRPLEDRLNDCHCVVTWTSNVAADAICAGVPVFCGRECAAWPMAACLDDLRYLETAGVLCRPDRGNWLTSLAWGQFTVAEIRAGFASGVVLGDALCPA